MRLNTYSEKLKHPKWQQMRLRVLERDQFSCQCCGDKDSTLHVHHTYYVKGRDPWEYAPSSLVTLCEVCHSQEHSMLHREDQFVLEAFKNCGARSCEMNELGYEIYRAWQEEGKRRYENLQAGIPWTRKSMQVRDEEWSLLCGSIAKILTAIWEGRAEDVRCAMDLLYPVTTAKDGDA